MKDKINDPDYDWLIDHVQKDGVLPDRSELAEKVVLLLKARLKDGALPYTLGVFGGWGTGKTTFLAHG